MDAFLASTAFVVLAEMGDKTQLLGMAMATRFKIRTVFLGVFIGTVTNHFLAVALGSYITNFVDMDLLKFIVALTFIIFGLWTFRGDELAGEEKKTYFNPLMTVTIAFFLAEMGDKTQLASISLAAKYASILPVWLGTTTGMMISNAIGITVGVLLGKRIPERGVKIFSGTIFILFGFLSVYSSGMIFGETARNLILLACFFVCLAFLWFIRRKR